MSQRATLTSRAALASVAVALLLAGLKGYAVWRTGSIAMLGSLADTGLDVTASLVTLFAVRFAAQPADLDHRFGHGKAEALAALFQVAVIAVAAALIVMRSLGRLGGGAAPAEPDTGIAISILAIGVTLALVAYQTHVLRKTGSVAIQADALHYRSDLALNAAVILALVLEGYWGVHGADPLFGVLIGLWLAWGAWRTAGHALDQLMDKEWPIEKRERFLAVAARHPAAEGIHDMRTRTSGARDFVQFHLWIDPAMTVGAAHRVMEEVEAMLRREFPHTDILIHPDPLGHVDRGAPLRTQDALEILAQEKAQEQ